MEHGHWCPVLLRSGESPQAGPPSEAGGAAHSGVTCLGQQQAKCRKAFSRDAKGPASSVVVCFSLKQRRQISKKT